MISPTCSEASSAVAPNKLPPLMFSHHHHHHAAPPPPVPPPHLPPHPPLPPSKPEVTPGALSISTPGAEAAAAVAAGFVASAPVFMTQPPGLLQILVSAEKCQVC